MLKSLDLLTIINKGPNVTVYLFSKQEKILLPLEIPLEETTQIPKNYRFPNIYDAYKNTLLKTGAQIISVQIHCQLAGLYHCYLNVFSNDNLYQINTGVFDCICIAKIFDVPIFVEAEHLSKMGIKVTKKLITESLDLES